MQRRTKIYLAIGIGVFTLLCLVGAATVAIIAFVSADPSERIDQEFGGQHLKTAIALIELHKVRYGECPDTLDTDGLLRRGRVRLGRKTGTRDATRLLAWHP